jgi:predicted O-methyltransferase YrrM
MPTEFRTNGRSGRPTTVRIKRAVRSTVRALPYGFRERLARLILPTAPDSAPAVAPAAGSGAGDDGELVRRAAAVPFERWEEHGWHLTPNHFYSPVPDTRRLPDTLWQKESELPGIDMRDEEQLAFLHEVVERFGDELNGLPRNQADAAAGGYFVDNGAFESVDGELYYAMIRANRPAQVLEIGAGWSTLLALQALRANRAEGAEGRLLTVEPYPYEFVRAAVGSEPEAAELRDVPVQDLPLTVFEALGPGDILFIDSSHVLRIGSDVQYEFLEILPRLRAGVLVHVHDVFLPGEYPRDWVLGPEHRFWNEQYLLQAYLADNSRSTVVWGSSWMHRRHPEELENAFASYDRRSRFPGSFWFRRSRAEV